MNTKVIDPAAPRTGVLLPTSSPRAKVEWAQHKVEYLPWGHLKRVIPDDGREPYYEYIGGMDEQRD